MIKRYRLGETGVVVKVEKNEWGLVCLTFDHKETAATYLDPDKRKDKEKIDSLFPGPEPVIEQATEVEG